jgi:hypothetical protein
MCLEVLQNLLEASAGTVDVPPNIRMELHRVRRDV